MPDEKLNRITSQVAAAPVDLAVRLYRRPGWVWFIGVPVLALAILSQNVVLTMVGGALAGAIAEVATAKAVLARADDTVLLLRASALLGRPTELAAELDPGDIHVVDTIRSGLAIEVRNVPWTVPRRWIPDFRTISVT